MLSDLFPSTQTLAISNKQKCPEVVLQFGGNDMSSPTSPLNPHQGLSPAQSFVLLPSYSSWAFGHPSTAPARSSGPSSACCTPASATLHFFSLFPAVALSLFTGAETGCCDSKVCASILQSPSQTSK